MLPITSCFLYSVSNKTPLNAPEARNSPEARGHCHAHWHRCNTQHIHTAGHTLLPRWQFSQPCPHRLRKDATKPSLYSLPASRGARCSASKPSPRAQHTAAPRPLTSAAHSMRLSPLSRGWKRPSSSRWRFSCRNSRSASLPISEPAGRRGPWETRTKGTGRPPLAEGRSHSAGEANRGPRGLLGGREREPGSRHRTDAGGLRRGHRIQAGRPAPPPAAGPARRPAASHGTARSTDTIPVPAELPPPPPRPRIKMEAARPRPRVFVLPARRWLRAERSRRGPVGKAPRGGKIVRARSRAP